MWAVDSRTFRYCMRKSVKVQGSNSHVLDLSNWLKNSALISQRPLEQNLHTHTHTQTWQKTTCWEVWRQNWNQKPQPRTREAAALSLLVVWIGIRELFQVVSVEIKRHLKCVGASRPLSVWSAARAHTVQVAATVSVQVYSYWLISTRLHVSLLNQLNKQTEEKINIR